MPSPVTRLLLVAALVLSTLPLTAGTLPLFGLNLAPREFSAALPRIGGPGKMRIRVPLQWGGLEPERGRYDFSRSDRLLDAARDRGFEVLVTVRSISPWGTVRPTRASQGAGYHSSSMPSDLEAWKGFLRRLAGRYRGRRVAWEVENEVNASAFWDGTMAEYSSLLRASYPALKEGDPDALVLPAAMACGVTRDFALQDSEAERRHDEFLEAVLATKAFDVVNVHDYYFPDRTVNGSTFGSYLARVQALAAGAGVGERPVWITEAGYVSRPAQVGGRTDPGSPEQQALWAERMLQEASERGVERVYGVLLQDRAETYFGSMGLLDAEGRPRPAWRLFQARP